jgi:hypothetical protein
LAACGQQSERRRMVRGGQGFCYITNIYHQLCQRYRGQLRSIGSSYIAIPEPQNFTLPSRIRHLPAAYRTWLLVVVCGLQADLTDATSLNVCSMQMQRSGAVLAYVCFRGEHCEAVAAMYPWNSSNCFWH